MPLYVCRHGISIFSLFLGEAIYVSDYESWQYVNFGVGSVPTLGGFLMMGLLIIVGDANALNLQEGLQEGQTSVQSRKKLMQDFQKIYKYVPGC